MGIELMTQELLLPVFREQLNTTFRAKIDDSTEVDLELISADPGPESARQEQFSLIFRGPLSPALAQRTYEVSHPVLGNTALFLVPVGKDQEGFLYESYFNRLLR
jgi:hypothetical protein